MSWEIATVIGLLGTAAIFAVLFTQLDRSQTSMKLIFFFLAMLMILVNVDYNIKLINFQEQSNATITGHTSNVTAFTQLKNDFETTYRIFVPILILIFFITFVLVLRDSFNFMRGRNQKLEEDTTV